MGAFSYFSAAFGSSPTTRGAPRMAGPWTEHRRFSRRRAVQVLFVAAFGLAGCRAVDHAQVDVLERELRQQEDYIYELEDVVMTYSEKLRECRSCQMAMSAPAN